MSRRTPKDKMREASQKSRNGDRTTVFDAAASSQGARFPQGNGTAVMNGSWASSFKDTVAPSGNINTSGSSFAKDVVPRRGS